MANVQHAGYVVTGNDAVWGTGHSADAAWDDFLREMESCDVVLLSDDDDSYEQLGSWARERDFTIRSASAALLAKVAGDGGNCGWRVRGGIACTIAEDDAA